MSKMVNTERGDLESRTFLLYPRMMDNTTYFDSEILINGQQRHLLLYYDEKFTDMGIRVTNLRCYQKLIRSFERTMLNIVALIENDSKRSVVMFGETLIVDREISKRWRESG